MASHEIIVTKHAVRRMVERHIWLADIREIIERGEIIAEYPADLPHRGPLIWGWNQSRPIHVVLSADQVQKKCYVIYGIATRPEPLES
jgi:hypothetical protein